MAEHAVIVIYELTRARCEKFGRDYAKRIRARCGKIGNTGHSDEFFIKVGGNYQLILGG
jgi:putative transposase